ncbi:ribbon-helix-helix protein, CopG family [Thiocystis violascens]|uniref:Uncharacterized protein n=1 Tax=Thiocystis violascens (strain ATCC 17096 / DSM 198 / 6111) TaxID=765911 RepID=I3Y971_THIV6|nr:CopG family transcriptional regulator [Thiocystis violascens]AFL73539.1 hypothetical protein Thivi_1548 [Thiocystis violascens DSM 198]
MPETKTTTLTVRIQPAVKEGLRTIAEQERRSLANMIEVLIREYCARHGAPIDGKQSTAQDPAWQN